MHVRLDSGPSLTPEEREGRGGHTSAIYRSSMSSRDSSLILPLLATDDVLAGRASSLGGAAAEQTNFT